MRLNPTVISPDFLLSALENPRMVLLDLRSPDQFRNNHIPGALNFAISDVLLPKPPIAAELPTLSQLQQIFSSVGIESSSYVVSYDEHSFGVACRLLWTLDAVGHSNWSLLDGGFSAWTKQNLPVSTEVVLPTSTEFPVQFNESVIAEKEYILSKLGNADCVIWDVRTEGEYTGKDRRSERAGHIPGAVNLAWNFAIDAENNKKLADSDALLGQLAEMGITRDKEIIVHCQSHNRSSHSYVLLRHLGFENVRGYAGSWSDWGNDSDTPID